MSGTYKPCISPYLYYINWNLSNCSFALTDYDFECVFLMCDRKWYSMPSDERLDWKYKCKNDPKKFTPHPLLERLIRGVKGNAFDEHPPKCKHYKTFATKKSLVRMNMKDIRSRYLFDDKE
ncbi:hypothetical protein T07_699, partial [Trichinella nelsoni]